MTDTKLFREQHKRIMHKVIELTNLLKIERLREDAMEARLAVAELAGLINVHLAMEDEALYPVLTANENIEIREIAAQYIEEMGGIGAEFKKYMKTWAHSDAAQEDPRHFIKETHSIVNKLSKRIYREDNELYVMVEKL